MIMDSGRTARQLYASLAAIFLNKKTHAVHLTSDLFEQRQDSLASPNSCGSRHHRRAP
jgi:hypothetical protein